MTVPKFAADAAARHVIITGAGSGIGRATARIMAERGNPLALFDKDDELLSVAAEELRESGATVLARCVDVSREDEVRDAFESVHSTWGAGADAVVHVAGVMRGQGADIRDVALDTWSEVISVNLTGAFLVAKHAARQMIPQGAGVIIVVGSGAGVVSPSGSIPYGASKGGVHGFALTLAAQLAPHGIRVQTLCPAMIDTPLWRRSIEERSENVGTADGSNATSAELGDPNGVGEILAFLVSERADYVRGTIFTR